MGIAKFDDGIPESPKFIAAGPIACWLWFAAVCYCRRAFTDGFIPKAKVPALILGLKQPFTHAAKLVEVGLWEDAVGGFQVHDFLHWNPSKKDMDTYRAHDKERKRRVRGLSTSDTDRTDVGRPSVVRDVSDPPGRTHAGAKSKSASESTSEDLDLLGESAREGDDDPPVSDVPPRWSSSRPARVGLATAHPHCVPSAAAACARGICVPATLVNREWLPQVGHDDTRITAFVATVLAGLPINGAIGVPDSFKFWRGKWAEVHGDASAVTRGRTRTDDTIDAGKEHLTRQLAEFAAEEGGPHVKRPALES